jgi:Zinc carboxypeptidase
VNRSPSLLALTAWLAVACSTSHAESTPKLKVTTDFSGGSARVEAIDQESRTISLKPAAHPDRGWVCWWYCKVEGVRSGETIILDVGGGVWATPDRAFFSLDNKNWTQTAPGTRKTDRIIYRQKVDATAVWFAWGPPFTLRQARELVEQATKTNPHATVFELCRSKDGRSVPALRIDEPGVKGQDRLGIWIQARQHAWESGSSWVCKGFVDWLLSDDPGAVGLRRKATITVVPIMDVDNVERGAGGKNGKPHDHNRDWSDKPFWPEVRAAQSQILQQSKAGRFDLFIDLHNPAPNDRQPFFFVSPTEILSSRARANLDAFLAATRKEMIGPLRVAPKSRESGKNYDPNWEKISKNWVTQHAGKHVVAVTLETSWNTPHSTAEGYQQVGKNLGRAVERYLRQPVRSGRTGR